MNHSWKPNPAALTTDVCARPGCTAQRRAHGDSRHEHRPNANAAWAVMDPATCAGASLRAQRKVAYAGGDAVSVGRFVQAPRRT